MGKVIESVTLCNWSDPTKKRIVDAVVDTGATLLVLPEEVVEGLALQKIRDVTVRYANHHTEKKGVYGVVSLTIGDRMGNFDVVQEKRGTQVLIGQIVLEELDLVPF